MYNYNFSYQELNTPQEFIEKCLHREYYYPTIPNVINAKSKNNIPIPAFYKPSNSKLVCVLGENGGGKSFFKRIVKIVSDLIHKDLIEVSPEDRWSKNKETPKPTYQYNYIKQISYGDEASHPSSFNTVNSVLSALDDCRTKYIGNYLFLDNPEMGLTDNYSCTMGMEIAQFVEKIPRETRIVFVSTNSKVLITELEYLNPQYLYFGDSNDHPKSIEEWLNEEIKPLPFSNLITGTQDRLNRIKTLIEKK